MRGEMHWSKYEADKRGEETIAPGGIDHKLQPEQTYPQKTLGGSDSPRLIRGSSAVEGTKGVIKAEFGGLTSDVRGGQERAHTYTTTNRRPRKWNSEYMQDGFDRSFSAAGVKGTGKGCLEADLQTLRIKLSIVIQENPAPFPDGIVNSDNHPATQLLLLSPPLQLSSNFNPRFLSFTYIQPPSRTGA